jgi:hypothetical protein
MPVTPSQRLDGRMWWNSPAECGLLREFALFANRLSFAVEADGELYRGTLDHLGGNNYRGGFTFSGHTTGEAWCTLVHSDGEYLLTGKWKQSGNPETFDWNASLERV